MRKNLRHYMVTIQHVKNPGSSAPAVRRSPLCPRIHRPLPRSGQDTRCPPWRILGERMNKNSHGFFSTQNIYICMRF